MIPAFNEDGRLPPGIHDASWDEFVARFGHTEHRRGLIGGLAQALLSLRRAGCRVVYLDGSFVTDKDIPNDYDGCWDVGGVDPSLLDPVLLQFDNWRAAQKAKFGGELFPAQGTEGGTGRVWLDFFQVDKDTGSAKGVVAIDLGSLPT